MIFGSTESCYVVSDLKLISGKFCGAQKEEAQKMVWRMVVLTISSVRFGHQLQKQQMGFSNGTIVMTAGGQ
jgi:hypothetical protein